MADQFPLPHDVGGLWAENAGPGPWSWPMMLLVLLLAAVVLWGVRRWLASRRKWNQSVAGASLPPAPPILGTAQTWGEDAPLQYYRNYFAWLTKVAFPGSPEGVTPREFGAAHAPLKDLSLRIERAVFGGEHIPFEEAAADWDQLEKLQRRQVPKTRNLDADLPSEIARKREASRL